MADRQSTRVDDQDTRARVRIVVVTYNSAGVLPGFLDALPGACNGVDWELVVELPSGPDVTSINRPPI